MDASQATERGEALAAFLKAAGWGEAERAVLAGDASTRRYDRLRLGDRTAVLMDAPPHAERPACPPDASPEQRRALGYNAMARLAGPNAAAFAGLARELRARGFSAPDIYAADVENGFLLLEDLGDTLFARAIEAGEAPDALYAAAVDLLAALRRASLPDRVAEQGREWSVLSYDPVALQTEADLFLEWYAPERLRMRVSEDAREEWRQAWAGLFTHLNAEPGVLALRDVHAENLIWLPEREGLARAGLLDFQDALFGHPAYDLVSLLEDARRDVPKSLADAMIKRYVERAYIDDEAGFYRAYAVLGAQRNAKILGIFVRLAVRDGKTAYLRHLPRVARHFLADLAEPGLEPLAQWVRRHAPALAEEVRA